MNFKLQYIHKIVQLIDIMICKCVFGGYQGPKDGKEDISI